MMESSDIPIFFLKETFLNQYFVVFLYRNSRLLGHFPVSKVSVSQKEGSIFLTKKSVERGCFGVTG